MAINRGDIEKLAQLSRLRFDGDDAEDIEGKLNAIVAFVDQLQSADCSGVTPMAHPHDQVQRLRDDVAQPDIDRDALQASAGAVADGLYLVPKVIE